MPWFKCGTLKENEIEHNHSLTSLIQEMLGVIGNRNSGFGTANPSV